MALALQDQGLLDRLSRRTQHINHRPRYRARAIIKSALSHSRRPARHDSRGI